MSTVNDISFNSDCFLRNEDDERIVQISASDVDGVAECFKNEVKKNASKEVVLSWSSINASVRKDRSRYCSEKFIPWSNCRRYLVENQILRGITGLAMPGRILAIMGASGSGKTTLLNVLTGRNTKGLKIVGEIKVNGQKVGQNIRSISAYVQQEDLFIGTFKVIEHMKFQAALRLDKVLSKQERDETVQQIIVDLGLKKCENTVIGVKGQTKGISGGERKRLAFASEILSNPAIMFCDEPTSGLDSFMAQQVISALKEIAKKGKTIVCTVHQPSSQVFQHFDDLCLLAEGSAVYMGPTKEASAVFNSANFPCPRNFNPSDHYVRVLAVVPGLEDECKRRIKKICGVYENSEIAAELRRYQKEILINSSFENFANNQQKCQNKYKTTWIVQFNALFWRASIQNIREPLLIKVRIWKTIIFSFLLGLLFFNIELNDKTIQDIQGVLFVFILQMTFQFIFSVVHVFCDEYSIFIREHLSRMYRVDAYYFAKTISELPQYIIFPTLFTVILYVMAGLTLNAKVFFACIGINILSANVAVSLGFTTSTLFPDLNLALTVTPMLIMPCMIFGGFFINENTVPVYFVWIQYLSYIRYSYEAISINYWQTIDYIAGCENHTCPINGTAVLQTMHFNPNLFNFNIFILCLMFVVLRLISFAALLIRCYVQN